MSIKIVVAGAGIGGLCAALALAKRGFEVAVYEQSSQVAEVGAGLQLSPNAMHVLKALGIVEQVKAKGFRPKSAVMRHFQSGKTYFTVPLGDTALHKFAADYLHIHRADLLSVLYAECKQANVSIHLGQQLRSYHHSADKLSIKFENDQNLEADLLIGADGIKSKVQACMLGQTPAQFTGQVAWRGVVAADKLPQGLIKPNANLWVGPGKHFVSYYLRGGELVNFVAVQERSDWQKESWHEAGDIQELRNTFVDWHPEVTELLAATEQCFLWALFDRQPLSHWTDKNVALLGDACHPMLPFLAQGAAMAIEDSYALVHCLVEQTVADQSSLNQNHIQNALLKYQQIRLSRASSIQGGARKNAGLYHMNSAFDKTKLAVLSGLASLGLSDTVAANKLDVIYSYNITEELS